MISPITTNNKNWKNWAWLAGFIDGEGYLGILKQQKKETRRQSASFLYHPYLIITGTDFSCIEDIKNMIGSGRVYTLTRKRDKKHKTAYQYKLTEFKSLSKVLNKISPYLRVKNKQCVLLNKFIDIRQGKKRISGRGSRGSTTFTTEEETIFQKLLQLNKRGI